MTGRQLGAEGAGMAGTADGDGAAVGASAVGASADAEGLAALGVTAEAERVYRALLRVGSADPAELGAGGADVVGALAVL
ncbi:hypothetical protein, partial [Mangrovactinospora gilvigrisea]|uniref:hypothetical protein n=1 Tax=Mangrovactinospora gilvigrisea TaxID=1428644 RepID=UPI001C31D1C1